MKKKLGIVLGIIVIGIAVFFGVQLLNKESGNQILTTTSSSSSSSLSSYSGLNDDLINLSKLQTQYKEAEKNGDRELMLSLNEKIKELEIRINGKSEQSSSQAQKLNDYVSILGLGNIKDFRSLGLNIQDLDLSLTVKRVNSNSTTSGQFLSILNNEFLDNAEKVGYLKYNFSGYTNGYNIFLKKNKADNINHKDQLKDADYLIINNGYILECKESCSVIDRWRNPYAGTFAPFSLNNLKNMKGGFLGNLLRLYTLLYSDLSKDFSIESVDNIQDMEGNNVTGSKCFKVKLTTVWDYEYNYCLDENGVPKYGLLKEPGGEWFPEFIFYFEWNLKKYELGNGTKEMTLPVSFNPTFPGYNDYQKNLAQEYQKYELIRKTFNIDTSSCFNEKDYSKQDICISDIYKKEAKSKKQYNICALITNTLERDRCYIQLSVYTNNNKICGLLSPFYKLQDECQKITESKNNDKNYFLEAEKTGNAELCKKISDPKSIEICSMKVSIKSGNMEGCNNLTEEINKQKCIEGVQDSQYFTQAVNAKDVTICEKIKDPQNKQICILDVNK